MSEYPLTVEEIVLWFRTKGDVLRNLGITLAEIREYREHNQKALDKPSASADFDTLLAMGRISVWVSGEIDFHVLRVSDGKDVFIHHEKVSTLSDLSLENAYKSFLQSMMHPDGGS